MNLIDVSTRFASDEQCLEFLEKARWPDGVRCPICGADKISRVQRESRSKNRRTRLYTCLEPTCRQQFSPTSGTLFHDSHLPLRKWFLAVALIMDAKKGMSANQLKRHLKVNYRTAWYLAHRIRKAMAEQGSPLAGIVEVDETYIGGKARGKGTGQGRYNKQTVMAARQRKGQLRYEHVPIGSAAVAKEFIEAHVSPQVEKIMTDKSTIYPPALKALGLKDRHHFVDHIAGEYVRGDVHTNTVENAFSLFKRGIIGSFHKVSIKHLHRYLSEFEYRFNRREIKDAFRETMGRLVNTGGMPYQKLIAEP